MKSVLTAFLTIVVFAVSCSRPLSRPSSDVPLRSEQTAETISQPTASDPSPFLADDRAIAFRVVDALSAASEVYRTRFGTYPSDIDALGREGYLPFVLSSLCGYGYLLESHKNLRLKVQAAPKPDRVTMRNALKDIAFPRHTFFCDESGVTRYAERGWADLESPPVPE